MGVPVSEHPRVARLIDAPPRQLPPDAPPLRAIPRRLVPAKIFSVARTCAKAASLALVALPRPTPLPASLPCWPMAARWMTSGYCRSRLCKRSASFDPIPTNRTMCKAFRCASVPGSGWVGTRNPKILAARSAITQGQLATPARAVPLPGQILTSGWPWRSATIACSCRQILHKIRSGRLSLWRLAQTDAAIESPRQLLHTAPWSSRAEGPEATPIRRSVERRGNSSCRPISVRPDRRPG